MFDKYAIAFVNVKPRLREHTKHAVRRVAARVQVAQQLPLSDIDFSRFEDLQTASCKALEVRRSVDFAKVTLAHNDTDHKLCLPARSHGARRATRIVIDRGVQQRIRVIFDFCTPPRRRWGVGSHRHDYKD